MLIKMMRRRRMKQPLSHHSMAHLYLPFQQSSYSFSKCVILSVLLCSFTCASESASVIGSTNRNSNNNQVRNRVANNGLQQRYPSNYHFLDQHNEYDSSSSGVSILDDDTVRLSLAIDDDASAGLSSPSLHILEPKVYLRVSGESGMIRPDYQRADSSKDDTYSRASFKAGVPTDLHSLEEDEEEEHEGEDDDDDMNDNYHHHFPYIESYREKYVKPDLHHPTATPAPSDDSLVRKESKSKEAQQNQHVWSDIIAQVTTPSSFNEINSSASEHRLADFHIRANLPSYFYNKYSSYSEEDLENVADLDDEHSKYFVKTRPRSVTSAGSNIYSNFYYEPPSFSTKSVPIPVKTNKERFVFASAKPTQEPQHLVNDRDYGDIIVESHFQSHDDDQFHQQDTSVMTTIPSSLSNLPTMTPQLNYDSEGDDSHVKNESPHRSNIGPTTRTTFDHHYHNQVTRQSFSTGKPPTTRSSDASTSHSIMSKVSVNNPLGKSEAKTTSATPAVDVLTSSHDSSITATTEATTTTTDATSIPGMPGVDYPTLGEIPQTGFDCKNQRYKGFFADIDAKCQAWHYCDFTDGHSTFLCPNGTLFSQVLLTCDWWFNVDCHQARQLYVLNERLYRYIKPPKPSFPEDFIGEHVDKWLIQQLQMGLLPKVRKKAKAKLVALPPPAEPPTPKSN